MAIAFPDISPVAFSLGSLKVRWYSLAYLFGILASWGIIRTYCKRVPSALTPKRVDDFVTWAVVAIIAGGRLGYVLFYNFGFYMSNPLKIFMLWDGGMSFHGAVLALIAAVLLYCHKYKISPVQFGDLICLTAPIGLFLGRIANFINGELYGRKAPGFEYAVVFPRTDGVPRHASQLYEAFLEGFVLFAIMNLLWWLVPKLREKRGLFVGLFFSLYAVFRVIIEGFREPDAQIGYFWGQVTMGQILCLPMVFFGVCFIVYSFGKRDDG